MKTFIKSSCKARLELSKKISRSHMFSVNFMKCFIIATMQNIYDSLILSMHHCVSIFKLLVPGFKQFSHLTPHENTRKSLSVSDHFVGLALKRLTNLFSYLCVYLWLKNL